MQLLTKEVRLVCQQDVSTLNLTKEEAEVGDFFSSEPDMRAIRTDGVSECLCNITYARQRVFLFGLERQALELFLP